MGAHTVLVPSCVFARAVQSSSCVQRPPPLSTTSQPLLAVAAALAGAGDDTSISVWNLLGDLEDLSGYLAEIVYDKNANTKGIYSVPVRPKPYGPVTRPTLR